MARSTSAFIPTHLRGGPQAGHARPLPTEEPPESVEVVIIGAGIAGLMAAYELQKRGIGTHLLEAQSTPGGRVATAHYGQGLAAESGLQEIWSNNPLLGVANELGVELEMRDERHAHSTFVYGDKIYKDVCDGKTRGYRDSFLQPEEWQALRSWLNAAKILYKRAMSVGLADCRVRALQEISYRQWVTSARLSQVTQAWLRLHLEIELGSDWNRFSALFALLEMEIFFDGGSPCYTVCGGNGTLIDALAGASGPLTTGAHVTAINQVRDHGGGPRLQVRYLKDRRAAAIKADRVVLAIPCHRIRQLVIKPELSEAHREALGSLQMGHYTPVHLIMARGDTSMTDDDVAMPGAILTSGPLGYVYGVVSTNRTKAVFSLLAYGKHARALHRSPQSRNVQKLLAELDWIRPGFRDQVLDAHVYPYDPAAVPVWGPGRSPLDRRSALLREPVHGLHFAGDYIYGAHSNSAALSGMRAARQIAGELQLPSREVAQRRLPQPPAETLRQDRARRSDFTSEIAHSPQMTCSPMQ